MRKTVFAAKTNTSTQTFSEKMPKLLLILEQTLTKLVNY